MQQTEKGIYPKLTKLNKRLGIVLTVYYLILLFLKEPINSLETLFSLYAAGIALAICSIFLVSLRSLTSKHYMKDDLEIIYVSLIGHFLYPVPFIVLTTLL